MTDYSTKEKHCPLDYSETVKDLATICKVGMVMLPRAVLRTGWKGVESPRMPNKSYFLVKEKLPRKLCQVEKRTN